MDLVLGLSMTSAAVRWVLVEGTTGEGATVDRGSFDLTADVDPDALLDVLLAEHADDQMHAIGVTWTNEAENAASEVLDAFTARGFDNVIAISELEAGDELAAGISAITEYDDVGVCIVEPDAAVVALVTPAGVTVDRVGRPGDGTDAIELPCSVITMLEIGDWQPEAIFVVGSADDLDLIESTLAGATDAPVISAADADLAMARGAALASARAVNALQPAGPHLPSRIGALTSVVAAAAVTLVVSLSVVVGLSFTGEPAPDAPPPAQAAAQEPTRTVAPKPSRVPTPAEAMKVVAQTIVVAAPVVPVYVPPAPSYVPPAPAYTPPTPAYTPPAPAYVAPAPPPVYVPPVVPQPRLRDRIIERIPIINRFHEPEYQNGR